MRPTPGDAPKRTPSGGDASAGFIVPLDVLASWRGGRQRIPARLFARGGMAGRLSEPTGARPLITPIRGLPATPAPRPGAPGAAIKFNYPARADAGDLSCAPRRNAATCCTGSPCSAVRWCVCVRRPAQLPAFFEIWSGHRRLVRVAIFRRSGKLSGPLSRVDALSSAGVQRSPLS